MCCAASGHAAVRWMQRRIDGTPAPPASAAVEKAGIEPLIIPGRGGTDGANLSFKGLPCPNLGTGGYAFHGPYEHITVEGMDKTVEILENIVAIYADMPK